MEGRCHRHPIDPASGKTRDLGAACEPSEPRTRPAISHAFLAHGRVRLDRITAQIEIEQHAGQLAGAGSNIGKRQFGAGEIVVPHKTRQHGPRICRAVEVSPGEIRKVAVANGGCHGDAPERKPRAFTSRSSTTSGEQLPSFSMVMSGCSGSCAGRSMPTTFLISPRSARV